MNCRVLLMAFSLVAFALTLSADAYTSTSYAKRENLIAQWDAIDNVGTGAHNPNATVWKNLASTGDIYDLTLTNSACWKNGDRLVVNRTSAIGTRGMPGYKTIEVVFRMTMTPGASNGRILFGSGDGEVRQLVTIPLLGSGRQTPLLLLCPCAGV